MKKLPVHSRLGRVRMTCAASAMISGVRLPLDRLVAAEQVLHRGGGDDRARPERVDRDALPPGTRRPCPSTHMLMPNFAIV